jgi:mono/diheme cytochrome c family protein
MKTLLKTLKWTGIVLTIAIIALVVAVYSRQHLKYDAPYPDLRASKDSAVIARGNYLVNGPAHCSGCHTEDQAAFERGEHVVMHGGYEFKLPFAHIFTKNITSDTVNGIGRLTDGEIARTLRYGVGSDGRAIYDFMPFYMLSDSDLTAVISYLRTLPADPRPVPENTSNFMGKVVQAFFITPRGPLDVERPKGMVTDSSVAYGEYLANSVANCVGCHTERDLRTGAFIGPRFAGWTNFMAHDPNTHFNTPNLTPDPTTGHLKDWDFKTFRDRFHAGPRIQGSPMPWVNFGRMSDDDLKAIWNYLHSLPPVQHETGPLLAPVETN